jgi:nicotinamidase-related amidase
MGRQTAGCGAMIAQLSAAGGVLSSALPLAAGGCGRADYPEHRHSTRRLPLEAGGRAACFPTAPAASGAFRCQKENVMTTPYQRLDKNNAAVLLVDHQAGLLSLVRDIDPDKFKNNVLALGNLAQYFKLPTILTTSFESGPNGPLVPELKAQFPDAPYIARPGQINAWDNADFVQAVKATGKQQLILAGVVTEVCVAFPALSALEEGFEVFVVTDASGTFNDITRQAAWARMSQAGAQLMTWFGVACELHRDWRNDIEGLGTLFSNHIPDYRNLITSYTTLTAGK